MRLTDMTIQKLSIPERGQKVHPDDTLPGFGVRVSQGGTKTFVLCIGEERRRVTIGRYPIVSLAQAREKAKHILAERQLGIVHKPSPSFATVREEYLALRDDRVRRATRQADGYLFKPFADLSERKLADIAPEMLEEMIDGLGAPSTRRHAFLRLQGLFRYAVKRGYLDRSPMDRLDCPPDRDPRERVLSEAELRAVIEAARGYKHPFGKIVELLILTGQRRQQIGGLNRSFVDFDACTITWPPALMKTARRHVIPLGAMTRTILEKIPTDRDGYFFASQAGGGFVGWSYHVERFQCACGFSDWVLHDLRRTLATYWQELGIEIATTEKMLSHSAVTGGLVGIYQRSSYLAQMRAAVEKWEAKLASLLASRAA
jgi:integrase